VDGQLVLQLWTSTLDFLQTVLLAWIAAQAKFSADERNRRQREEGKEEK
jgi:hypothetical protein